MPKVIFRNIRESDLETIRAWRNSPNIARNMFSSNKITEEQQYEWYKSVYRGERGYCWFVECNEGPVGYASLSRAERAGDTYEFGLYIGNQNLAGQGYGKAILLGLFHQAFNKLNAHKVICEVLSFNSTAIRLYERCGMHRQGYFKDYLKRDNDRIDCISYAIFKDEWDKLCNDLIK